MSEFVCYLITIDVWAWIESHKDTNTYKGLDLLRGCFVPLPWLFTVYRVVDVGVLVRIPRNRAPDVSYKLHEDLKRISRIHGVRESRIELHMLNYQRGIRRCLRGCWRRLSTPCLTLLFWQRLLRDEFCFLLNSRIIKGTFHSYIQLVKLDDVCVVGKQMFRCGIVFFLIGNGMDAMAGAMAVDRIFVRWEGGNAICARYLRERLHPKTLNS